MQQPPRSSSAPAALLSIVLSLLLAFTLSCQAFLQQPALFPSTVRWQQQRQQERTLTRRAAGGSNAEGKKEFFRLSHGRMEFGTVDRVEMVLYEEADVIHQYITESPDRVILATWDEELVKRQGRDVFRLTTKPLQFITLSLQPSIDVKVSTGEQALWVESLAHSMNGAERLLGQSFAESLKIEVKGKLHAVPGKQGPGLTTLVGDVQLFTSGQLPLLFSLTPRPVLETAAVAINRRIMGYAKGKFVENLARDFDAWAAASASSSRKQPPPQQQQRKAAG